MSPRPDPLSVSRRWSLPLLCAVQSCERFAFLAMLPMFVLYAHDRHEMPAPTALMVLAIFQALSYLGGLPAGWLTDRKLGVRASTVLGAGLLTLGYGWLALQRSAVLWPALGLMVAGHCLFRPGLHVLIARAVGDDERVRERGFLWHYLAANLGYAAGALFGEWAHATGGWGRLFNGAAVASLFGAALLVLGVPWLRHSPADTGMTSERRTVTTGNLHAVWLLCGVAVIFWLTAQQAGSSLTVFAAMNTVQQITLLGHSVPIGPGHFASLHGLIVIAMLPVFLFLQSRRDTHTGSTTDKLIWGYVATAAAFALMSAAGLRGGDAGRVSGVWLVGCYVLLSFAEILLAPLGVSLVTRLAPQHKATQAVGLWFAGSAVGNGLAGALGLCWDRWPHHRYFAVLAVFSLAAAAALLSRRRQLDWLTALSTPIAIPLQAPAQSARWARMFLVALSLVLPCVFVLNYGLPLVVRGISAIVCGLAVLLGGPYFFSHALMRWARRETADTSGAP